MPNILIGAGHGKRPDGTFDNGAVNPNDGTREHDLNLSVAAACTNRLKDLFPLSQIGLDTAIFGKASEPNWQGLIKYLHDSPTVWNLAIEIHHDSYNAVKAGFGILPRNSFLGRVGSLAECISTSYSLFGLPVKPSYRDRKSVV